MSMQLWADAIDMARANRLQDDWRGALRMMRTDAYLILALFRVRQVCRRLHIPFANRILRVMQMVFGGIELGNTIKRHV